MKRPRSKRDWRMAGWGAFLRGERERKRNGHVWTDEPFDPEALKVYVRVSVRHMVRAEFCRRRGR